MITKFLTSIWVAAPILLIAAAAVAALYMKGRVMEAKLAGSLLLVAFILIAWGGRKKSDRDIKD